MRTVPRTRRYVSPGTIRLCRPLLSFDYGREAYVLRAVGSRRGPVLREDRRRGDSSYSGPERRREIAAQQAPARATALRG